MKIQFILKKNECYSFVSYTRRSSGLWNSTRYIVQALINRGVDVEIVEVDDNNDIDREVTRFRPDLVVIEALWVVPEKFQVLRHLHPRVKWFVHMHSGLPFLALEGIAMEWLSWYWQKGVGVIANSPESFEAFKSIIPDHDKAYGGFPRPLTFLPNVYLSNFLKPHFHTHKTHIDIGCFGAVRPMKNHLIQALAAIRFSEEHGLPCYFHINGSRVETGGAPVLKNLRQLFANKKHHKLVESKWNEPEDFLEYLHTRIDIGMQVSLTETFNVVTADCVTAAIPVVTSKEVKWVSPLCMAEDDSIDSIVQTMKRVWRNKTLIAKNQKLLLKNSEHAQKLWFEWAMSYKRD